MHPKFQKGVDNNPAMLEMILKRESISPTIPKDTPFNNTMLSYKKGAKFSSTLNTFEVEKGYAGYGNFGP